jgi:TPR repeat protein
MDSNIAITIKKYPFDDMDLNVLSEYGDPLDISYESACVILTKTYYDNHNYEKMLKFGMCALMNDIGKDVCAHIIGRYYKSLGQFDTMKSYYNIAIEKQFVPAINDMAFFYLFEEKNDIEAIKYYEMAITTKKDTFAMVKLAEYYFDIDKTKSKEYIIMAIDHGYLHGVTMILAFFINNEIPIDCDSFTKILPYITNEMIIDEQIRLYIIHNCINYNIYNKNIFDIYVKHYDEEQDCNICFEKKNDFVMLRCNHNMCTYCFAQNITITNTKCYCSKSFVM